MPNYREQLAVNGDRTNIRRQVIMKFLEEEPGMGKGENCSKYIYEVEDVSNGGKIFLRRPAVLNKGMDFTVHAENVRFRERGLVDMPSHSNIAADLLLKKETESIKYVRVSELIQRIYRCENIRPYEFDNINFDTGLAADIILKSIKWLFIEQDVTYWNWSGRGMLFSGLREQGLC
jgi:hypothetical protein